MSSRDSSFIKLWNQEKDSWHACPVAGSPTQAGRLKEWVWQAHQLSKHPSSGIWSWKGCWRIPGAQLRAICMLESSLNCCFVLFQKTGCDYRSERFTWTIITFRFIVVACPWTETNMSKCSAPLNEKGVEEWHQGSLNFGVNQIDLWNLLKINQPRSNNLMLKGTLRVKHIVLPNFEFLSDTFYYTLTHIQTIGRCSLKIGLRVPYL